MHHTTTHHGVDFSEVASELSSHLGRAVQPCQRLRLPHLKHRVACAVQLQPLGVDLVFHGLALRLGSLDFLLACISVCRVGYLDELWIHRGECRIAFGSAMFHQGV